jgi:hypothetical protein
MSLHILHEHSVCHNDGPCSHGYRESHIQRVIGRVVCGKADIEGYIVQVEPVRGRRLHHSSKQSQPLSVGASQRRGPVGMLEHVVRRSSGQRSRQRSPYLLEVRKDRPVADNKAVLPLASTTQRWLRLAALPDSEVAGLYPNEAMTD